MPVDPVNSALSQRPAPARAPARVALALGLAGALGEELLALLIASSAYRQVVVGVTQPLGSATARFSPWVVGHGYPIVDEAWICVTGDETFVPSASPMYRVDEAGLLEAAAVAKSCGAARLTVVAPLAALLQLGAGAQSVSSASEIALVEMGFNPLVIVRPTAADADEPGASLPHRIVRSAVCAGAVGQVGCAGDHRSKRRCTPRRHRGECTRTAQADRGALPIAAAQAQGKLALAGSATSSLGTHLR